MQNADHRRLCYSKLIRPFSKPKSLYIRYAQFFHFLLFLISEIFFYGMQNVKGKRVLGKFEIINVRHTVSFVAHKRNSVDF